MEGLSVRSIVFISFPFSDLSDSKLRPALVIGEAGMGDWVLCQITSQPYRDNKAVAIKTGDFAEGGLRVASYVRPGKIFTAHESLIQKQVAVLGQDVHNKVVDRIITLLQNG